MAWRVLSTNNTRVNGMGDVTIFGNDPCDSLLIWSNNATPAAVNTVKSFTTLVDYYASYGVPMKLYGAGATNTTLNQIMWNLSITKDQCNPLIMWTRGSQIEVPYIQRGRYISPTDLDTLIRSSRSHDARIDRIPIYGTLAESTTPAPETTSSSPTSTTTPTNTVSTGGSSSTTVTPLAPSGGSSVSGSSGTTAPTSSNVAIASRFSDDNLNTTQSASNDLSAGSKAGISVGVVAGVVVVAALVYMYYRKKRGGRVAPL